jgi:ABC-type sulfate transport system permease component
MAVAGTRPLIPRAKWRRRRVLPGFGLTLGFTLSYLSLIVLIPLLVLFVQAPSSRTRARLRHSGSASGSRFWRP